MFQVEMDPMDEQDREEFARQDAVMDAASRAFEDGDPLVGMIWISKLARRDDDWGEDFS